MRCGRAGQSAVVACSALRRAYRDILIGDRPDVRAGVSARLEGPDRASAWRRAKGHFMPPALLDSQFATLEEPGPDEHPIIVDIGGTPERNRRSHQPTEEQAVHERTSSPFTRACADRVVFITGGASGIGAAQVTPFRRAGRQGRVRRHRR